MAALIIAENIRPRNAVPRLKKATTRIDMTPMVDLGFLLICFFVVTTTMTEPRVADLYMPKEGPPIAIADSKIMTVLLDGNSRIFYYCGNWPDALQNGAIFATGYGPKDGLGNSIRQKQKSAVKLNAGKEDRKGFMLVIKPTDKSNYKNLMDVLDETLINDVRHYAVVAITRAEMDYLTAH